MKIGIWGGTFDPPHLGHLTMMKESASALGFDQILVVPNHIPPHKTVSQSSLHRKNMLSLLCEQEHLLRLDCRELESEQTSYSVTTCLDLRQEYPNDELVFCMGADSYQQFHTWFDWRQILALVDIAVICRPHYPATNKVVEEYLEQSKLPLSKVSHLQLSLVDVSSTTIRLALKNAKRVDDQLPLSVLNYIRENSLYL